MIIEELEQTLESLERRKVSHLECIRALNDEIIELHAQILWQMNRENL